MKYFLFILGVSFYGIFMYNQFQVKMTNNSEVVNIKHSNITMMSHEDFLKLSNKELYQVNLDFIKDIESSDKDSIDDIQVKISNLVNRYNVVLFMKGNSDFPVCGFSSRLVGLLNELGVPFVGINILDSQKIYSGIKTFSNWPTLPQLYVDGKFIGGCDIAMNMYKNGELQTLLHDFIKNNQ